MPLLTTPALPAGHLRALTQPCLEVDTELRLRPWQPEDAAVVKAAFDDPGIQRWHPRRMDSLAEAAEWIADWDRRWTAETDVSWAVVGPDDRPLGQAGLREVQLFDGVAAMSYWVLPSARGAGVARRAAARVARWSLAELGLHRLALLHSTANTASCRVAARLGFALEGTLRGATRHADGWHDMHLHALLNRAS